MAPPLPLVLLAAAGLAASGLAGCNRELTCTTELTRAAGAFRGQASGSRGEAALRREATLVACGQLCARGGTGKADDCVGRCAADVQAGAVAAQTTCKEGSPR